jgi:hypothetical protein
MPWVISGRSTVRLSAGLAMAEIAAEDAAAPRKRRRDSE